MMCQHLSTPHPWTMIEQCHALAITNLPPHHGCNDNDSCTYRHYTLVPFFRYTRQALKKHRTMRTPTSFHEQIVLIVMHPLLDSAEAEKIGQVRSFKRGAYRHKSYCLKTTHTASLTCWSHGELPSCSAACGLRLTHGVRKGVLDCVLAWTASRRGVVRESYVGQPVYLKAV